MEQKRLRILVVENYPDTRNVLAWILTHLGHSVESVPDAGTAFDRLRQDGFDVLLTDVFLPDKSGWDFLRELRARGILPPQVISVSAMHVDDARGPSKAAGCHAHLVEPFRINELEAALR